MRTDSLEFSAAREMVGRSRPERGLSLLPCENRADPGPRQFGNSSAPPDHPGFSALELPVGNGGCISPGVAERNGSGTNGHAGSNGFTNGATNGTNGANGLSAAADTARRIQDCIAFMQQHLNEPLQVSALAARAHTSPSHFFVLFKRFTGSPPIDYFIRMRIQRACQLLESGSLHVKEVAAALGYEDPFYFSRVFKAVTHVPPSEYRFLKKDSGKKNSIFHSPNGKICNNTVRTQHERTQFFRRSNRV